MGVPKTLGFGLQIFAGSMQIIDYIIEICQGRRSGDKHIV